MYLWMWVMVVVAGATGQFLDALAGMGFGAISSTVMVSGGISAAVVIGTVNLAKVGSGLVSGVSHWHLGNVRWSWVIPLAVPAVAGGVLAALLVTRLPASVIRLVVPVVLLMMGLLILRRFLSASSVVPPVSGGSQDMAVSPSRMPWQALRQVVARTPPGWRLGCIGFIGGALNGLSGAFGPFATSALLLRHEGHPRFTIGTVNFVEFFVAAAVSITLFTQLDWSEFQWGLPLALIAGSILTAPIGAYLSRRLPPRIIGGFVGLTLIGLNVWSIARALV